LSDSVEGDNLGAANRAQSVACRIGCGVGEARDVIRAQPIAAALVVFALGYMVGRLASILPSHHSSAGRG